MEVRGSSPAEGVRRHLDRAQRATERAFTRLGAGLRIARASDDAAGLGRSERRRALLASHDAAERNVADGVGVTRTAEGALAEAGETLRDMRTVAVRSADGGLAESDRVNLQERFESLRELFEKITVEVEFNDTRLLDGSRHTIAVQAGVEAGDTVEIELEDVSAGELGLDTASVETPDEASASLAAIDAAIEAVGELRGRFGGAANELASALRSVGRARESLIRPESLLRDADLAVEMAELVHQRILAQGGVAVLSQANLSGAAAQQLLAG